MATVNCSVCTAEMVIDEPESEGYIVEGLNIIYNPDGTIANIDESNKKVRHIECPS